MAGNGARIILLVDDDRDINHANRVALELEGYSVESATTLELGLRMARDLKPDLVLLDVLLPDGNSLTVGQRISEELGSSVVYLSCLGSRADIVAGLRAGGDDYIVKPYVMEELLLRVNAVLRRRNARADAQPTLGRLVWHESAMQVSLDGSILQLTPREYAVATYLRAGIGRMIPTEELIREVWLGGQGEGLDNTVRKTIHGIRAKIEGSGCTIEHMRGRGYRFTLV